MGVGQYLGNKLLSIVLLAIGVSLLLSFGIKSVIAGWGAIFIILAGIYFWKHAPF